jgi:hypothetical protein
MPFPIQIGALLVCELNLPNLPLMTSQDYPSLVGHELQLSPSTRSTKRHVNGKVLGFAGFDVTNLTVFPIYDYTRQFFKPANTSK